jgi:phage shock protein A
MVAGLRLNNSSAWAAFDKMEEKVMSMEAEAESAGLLAAPDNLEAQFVRLEGSGTVEDELAALKRGQLAAKSSAPSRGSELGRPISEVLVGSREVVRELTGIDAELEQLRKRARAQ